jgi:anti-sigma factor RsiW
VLGRPTDVLTCYRTRRQLGAYLDGALGPDGVRLTERHLSSCATCQGEIGQLRRVKRALAESAAVPEPDWTGFFPGIVRGIAQQRVTPAPARRRPAFAFWPQWALAFVIWQGGRVPVAAEAGVHVAAATTEHPSATVMVYTPPEKDLAVVWVFDSDSD